MSDLRSAHITDHARLAMARRGITEAQVWQVLWAPHAVVPGNRPGREIAQGTVSLGDPQRVLRRVVVEVGQDPPEVVTVYATTRFRRYGAKP
jgi:hypothetical protein